ncbi:MAG: Hsp70 family protein, partial [Spirosomataceae bacterium]
DNQPSVELHVLQGERPLASQNRTLGRFHLDGIPPSPRGVPQVEVTFDVDANGILSVTAKDKGTGKEQNIRIEASSGLSDAEIQQMREEAKANEEADKIEKEKIEKVNAADSMIFSTQKQLSEYGDKLSVPNKTAIQAALAELQAAHGTKDIAAIDGAMEKINAAWQAASQEMYAAQQPEGGAEAPADGADTTTEEGAADEGVTDVNFEEVNEEKK